MIMLVFHRIGVRSSHWWTELNYKRTDQEVDYILIHISIGILSQIQATTLLDTSSALEYSQVKKLWTKCVNK